MTYGTSEENKTTRTGNREIISVSLPLSLYDTMQEVLDRYHMNRSAFIASAIADSLRNLGCRVGEQ